MPIQPIFIRKALLIVLLACGVPAAIAGESSQLPSGVIKALDRFSLSSEGLSVRVENLASRKLVLDYQSDTARNPASTMKLVTTYAVLDELSPGYQWDTEFFALGEIDENGVLDGDLAIRGGGDPYLVEESLDRMLTELWRRGLRHIRGDIVLDDSFFQLEPEDPAAFDGEPLRAYNVLPNALLVNFKVVRFWFEPNLTNNSVRITTLPRLPNLQVVNKLKLVPGRCRGYMRGIEIQAHEASVQFSGNFPAGCERYAIGRSMLDHDAYAYGLIRQRWQALGGQIDGGMRNEIVPAELEPLMVWNSKPYGEIIRSINKHSNNVMTRQVFLTLGAHYYGPPGSVEKGRGAVNQWLLDAGLLLPHLQLDNGSGLSRDARVSAAGLSGLLLHAWHSPYMPEFVGSLSLVGLDGTFARRHKEGVLTGRAHLKTGRLDDVTAMAGYVQARSGERYSIVVLHNDVDVHRGSGEVIQDAFLSWLYAFDEGSVDKAQVAVIEPLN